MALNNYINRRVYALPVNIIGCSWSNNHVCAAIIICKHVQTYLQKSISYKVDELYKLICFANMTGLGPTMERYSIVYRDKVFKKSNVFATCVACKCCARHQINKPKNITPWEELREWDMDNTHYPECRCACRHVARFLSSE